MRFRSRVGGGRLVGNCIGLGFFPIWILCKADQEFLPFVVLVDSPLLGVLLRFGVWDFFVDGAFNVGGSDQAGVVECALGIFPDGISYGLAQLFEVLLFDLELGPCWDGILRCPMCDLVSDCTVIGRRSESR